MVNIVQIYCLCLQKHDSSDINSSAWNGCEHSMFAILSLVNPIKSMQRAMEREEGKAQSVCSVFVSIPFFLSKLLNFIRGIIKFFIV